MRLPVLGDFVEVVLCVHVCANVCMCICIRTCKCVFVSVVRIFVYLYVCVCAGVRVFVDMWLGDLAGIRSSAIALFLQNNCCCHNCRYMQPQCYKYPAPVVLLLLFNTTGMALTNRAVVIA